MATLALDPIVVAKINALLISIQTGHSQSGLTEENVLDLLETLFLEPYAVPMTPEEGYQSYAYRMG
jgi:hypothetical protein